MAFPQVASVTPSQFSSAATSHSVAFPATVNAGDLLIILAASSNTGTQTPAASGFTLIGGNNNRCYLLAKVAAGTEGGSSVSLTMTNSATCAAQVIRITGWYGDLAGVENATANSVGSSAQANPPSVTASWGSDDNLWLACCGGVQDFTITGIPTDYTNDVLTDSGGGAATVVSTRRELASATNDPANFAGINPTTANRSYTIVIRPAGASSFIDNTSPILRHILGTAV